MSVREDAVEAVSAFREWFATLKTRYQLLVGSALVAAVLSVLPGINILGFSVFTLAVLVVVFIEIWDQMG